MLHIHDLDMLGGYCAGWSLRTLQNESAGAQAPVLPDFDEERLAAA